MDRLTSLTTFVRVVDSGGFSAAGRRLDMSTTMVSNHIKALKERLGARLLNRTTSKVSPTEVGNAYYGRCTRILADLEQADDIAGALQSHWQRGRYSLPSTAIAHRLTRCCWRRYPRAGDWWRRGDPEEFAFIRVFAKQASRTRRPAKSATATQITKQ